MNSFLLMVASDEDSMNAFQNWWIDSTSHWPVFVLKILGILLTVFICIKLIRYLARKLDVLLSKEILNRQLEVKYRKMVCSVFEWVLYILVAFVALTYLGVPMNSVMYAIITIFVALVVALKDYISIVASGIMLLVTHPFEIGNVITVCGSTTGQVTDTTFFHTILKTYDKQTIYIPNNQIMSGTIVNLSLEDKRILDLKFSITYESDLRKAKEVLYQIFHDTSFRIRGEEPAVVVSNLADSFVEMQCRVMVKNAEYWKAKWNLLEQVKLKLDEEKINFAYPHMSVQLQEHVQEQNE